jgi:hypothetical protein
MSAWSRLGGLVLAGTLVLAGQAHAAESRAEALLARWVAAAEASGSQISVAEKTVDASRDRIEWRGIRAMTLGQGGAGLTVRAACFEGLIERDGALMATRVELDDIAFGDHDGAAKIASVALADAYLPDFNAVTVPTTPSLGAVIGLFDAVWPMRLGRGEARDISLDVPDSSSGAPAGGRLTFGIGRVDIDELSDGRLARFSAARLSMRGSDRGQPLVLGAEAFRLERLDLGVVAAFLNRANYPGGTGDGVWRDVVGSYAVEGLAIQAAEASVRLGHYGIDGLALRRVDSGFLDLIEAGDAADPLLAIRGALGLVDSVRLGRYGVDGLAVAFAAPGAAGVQRGTIGLDSVELRDLSLAGLGAFRFDGFAVTADAVSVALKTFVVADTVFPRRETIAAAVTALAAGEDPKEPTALLPQVGRVALGGIAVEQTGSGRVALERLELRQSNFLAGLPTLASLEMMGLRLPADLSDPGWRTFMRAFGREALDLAARLTLRYDETAATLGQDLTVDVGGEGSVGAAITVTGVTRELFTALDRFEDYIGELGVGGGRLTLTDKGLGARLLNVAATWLGVSADDLRRVALERLPQVVAPIQDPARRQAIRAALARFLEPPATLTLNAHPAEPVPLLQLAAAVAANPWRLIDLLSVEATAAASP